MDACAGNARGSVPKPEGENVFKGEGSEFQDILQHKVKGGKTVNTCVYEPVVYVFMYV